MSQPLLEVADVEKTYPGGVRALAGVNLTIEPGETVALVGESGSGKTTLLRLFNRMVRPDRGTVRIRGREAGDWDPITLRRSIGYVQQDGGLLPHWTVEKNINLVPDLLGWDETRRKEQASRLLELVGMSMTGHGSRYPIELSGGQRQRVAIARALGGDPDIVLLDEPFGALDAITRVELHTEFLHMKQQLGKTMVLVTHDLAEAFRLGDRIAVMRDGGILQVDTPADLERNPSHEYVRTLLGHRGELMA